MENQGYQISNIRIFDPYIHHSDLNSLPDSTKAELFSPPANLIYSDLDTGISNLMVYFPIRRPPYVSRLAEAQESIIVVAIDGARKVEGTATASFGVWFGTASPFNANELLPTDLPQTTQAAELYAVKTALQTIRDMIRTCHKIKGLDHIIIMTESSFIKDGMSRDIWKWESNGYMTARKTPVANSDELKEVHELIKALEKMKVAVQFWLVEKKFNLDARRLSLEALGMEEVDIPDAKKKKPNRKQKKKKGVSSNDSGSGTGANDTDTKVETNDSVVNGSKIDDSTMVSAPTNNSATNRSTMSGSTKTVPD